MSAQQKYMGMQTADVLATRVDASLLQKIRGYTPETDMRGALSFQEKIRFRLRGLEHRHLLTAVRKAVVQTLPDPFEGRSSCLPDGREIVFLHVPKTGGITRFAAWACASNMVRGKRPGAVSTGLQIRLRARSRGAPLIQLQLPANSNRIEQISGRALGGNISGWVQ